MKLESFISGMCYTMWCKLANVAFQISELEVTGDFSVWEFGVMPPLSDTQENTWSCWLGACLLGLPMRFVA